MSTWTGSSLRKAASLSVGAFAVVGLASSVVVSFFTDSLRLDLGNVIVLALTPCIDRGHRGGIIALLVFTGLYLLASVTMLVGINFFSFSIGGKPAFTYQLPWIVVAAAVAFVWTSINAFLLAKVLRETKPRPKRPVG